MAAWADSSERFVEIPGIVEIRWVSDDPDYYVKPIDLFDEQSQGLPDWYGKKDRTTTEQAWFTCNVCECDLKSVVTLRAHCKGTQHVRKALQKKKEFKKTLSKKETPSADERQAESRPLSSLPEQLESTSEPVVGLEHITEYMREEGSRDVKFYHCSLQHCEEEQGDAEAMKFHILSLRHRQAWLEVKTGEYVKHQTEVIQRIAEFTSEYSRDYRVMRVVVDREEWRRASEGRIRATLNVKREKSWDSHCDRVKREDRGYRTKSRGEGSRPRGDGWREERREGAYGRDEYSRREREDRRDESRWSERRRNDSHRRDYEEETRETSEYTEERVNLKRSYEEEAIDWEDRKRRSDGRREERGEESWKEMKEARVGERRESREERGEENRERGVRRKERGGDEEVVELSRRGDFDNWSTQSVKVDPRVEEDQCQASTSSKTSEVVSRSNSVKEDVDRLHRKVADRVMRALNRFYPGAQEFEKDQYKIGSPEEYSKLAKTFSHRLRAAIKESYEAYHGSLDGINLTLDNEQFIKTDVESYFETVEVLRR